jgi:hypothetical protein
MHIITTVLYMFCTSICLAQSHDVISHSPICWRFLVVLMPFLWLFWYSSWLVSLSPLIHDTHSSCIRKPDSKRDLLLAALCIHSPEKERSCRIASADRLLRFLLALRSKCSFSVICCARLVYMYIFHWHRSYFPRNLLTHSLIGTSLSSTVNHIFRKITSSSCWSHHSFALLVVCFEFRTQCIRTTEYWNSDSTSNLYCKCNFR